MTMAPLGARRLREMVELGSASRRSSPWWPRKRPILHAEKLGAEDEGARDRARRDPFSGRGDPVPPDLKRVRDAIQAGRFAALR